MTRDEEDATSLELARRLFLFSSSLFSSLLHCTVRPLRHQTSEEKEPIFKHILS